MVNPETDFKSLNVEHITAEEKKMLENIQHDLDNHRDTIVDHGYTGVIDKEHINDITGSILISLVTRLIRMDPVISLMCSLSITPV